MTEAGRKVFLVFVASLWMLNASGADSEVSCVSKESCILPCSFQGSTDVDIYWIKEAPGDLHVHSYYNNQDQPTYQDQSFRNRTSLFKDQISRGNASLQLTGVKVQDQGRYRCDTSAIRGNSFINLKVDAPGGKVNPRSHGGAPGNSTNVRDIKGAVFAAIVAAVAVLLLL